MLAGTLETALDEAFNLGNPVEISIRELAERIRIACDSASDIVYRSYDEVYGRGFEDTKRRVPDTSKAERVLGWTPSVALDDGLARTIEWWRTNNA